MNSKGKRKQKHGLIFNDKIIALHFEFRYKFFSSPVLATFVVLINF